MSLVKITLTTVFFALLTACGGGGSPDKDVSGEITTGDSSSASPGTSTTPGNSLTVGSISLGSGSGVDFVRGKIEGNTNLFDDASTILTINAVDALNLNAVIESSNYIAQWSAECSNATFSINSQSLSASNIVTRYDANACAGTDTVTVKLFAKGDLVTVLDSASIALIIGETASVDALPKLGTGSGSDFNLGQLDLSTKLGGASYVLAGDNIIISVNGVNELDANALLTSDYLYKFESSCAAGTTRFSSDVITSATGQVANSYFNQTCSGGDTVTVKLFSAGADVNSDTPVATATASFNTEMPLLGSNSGADFIVGSISGNTNLVDEASTKLSATVIDPLNINTELSSADYYVEWSSPCATDSFSIESQNLTSSISTRYDSDPELCKAEVITVTLYNQFHNELDSMSATVFVAEGLEAVEPAIGVGAGVNFVPGTLDLAEADKIITVKQNVAMAVNIVDLAGANAALTGDDYTVVFDSLCAKGGRAEFDTLGIPNSEGIVKAVYRPLGCTGVDEISVMLYSVKDADTILSLVQGEITITEPLVNTIEFTGMTSRQIAMQGISFTALPEATAVSFVVRDEFNDPISSEEIVFSLSNSSVGATLAGQPDANGNIVSTTDADGLVTAFVNSGSTHGLVSVLAVIKSDPTKRTQSFNISITTGLPVQPAFSIAADNYHPKAWETNGTKVEISVNLDDRFNNPVPDGTQVNFIADGGQISPFCLTKNGGCTVDWASFDTRPGFGIDNDNVIQRSSLPHPANDPTSVFYCPSGIGCQSVSNDPSWNGGRSGVVTILAYTEGEVGFADGNGATGEANGRFDDGEYFSKMSEAYLDANENGQYDIPDGNNPFEKLIEYDGSGGYTARADVPDFYQGGTCSENARALGHCASLVHIRRSLQLIMSSNLVDIKLDSVTGSVDPDTSLAKDFTDSTCVNLSEEKSVTFNYLVSDFNGNIPIKNYSFGVDSVGFKIEALPGVVTTRSSLTAGYPVSITLDADGDWNDGYAQIFAKNLSGLVVGSSARSMRLTDNPSMDITTTDYILDISDESGPTVGGAPINKQIAYFKFTDACGNPPLPGDVIVVQVENVAVSLFSKTDVIDVDGVTNEKSSAAIPEQKNSRFQVFSSQLTDDGILRIQLDKILGNSESHGVLNISIHRQSTGAVYYSGAHSILL